MTAVRADKRDAWLLDARPTADMEAAARHA